MSRPAAAYAGRLRSSSTKASFWSGFPGWPCGLQIAPNSLIHNSQFLIRFASFLSDFNLDVGLLISGFKVRALVRPPSKSETYQNSPFEARRLKRFFKRCFLARGSQRCERPPSPEAPDATFAAGFRRMADPGATTTLPRLGSRVRIPSPAPNFLKEISILREGRREAAFVVSGVVSTWCPPRRGSPHQSVVRKASQDSMVLGVQRLPAWFEKRSGARISFRRDRSQG